MIYILYIFVILSFSLHGCGSGGGGNSPTSSNPGTESPLTATVNISGTPGDSDSPSIAFDPVGGEIYIAWEDDSSGHKEIYFTKTLSGGQSFIKPFSIYTTTYSSETPRILIDHNNQVHLAWLNTIGNPDTKELIYSSSVDGGTSFSQPRPISNIDNIEVSDMLLATNRFGNLLLVWVENNELYSSRSIDGGATFSPPKKVSGTGIFTMPHAQADRNGVYYLVWEDQVKGDILLSTSLDFGLTFSSAPINLSNNSGISETPVLSLQGIDAYALWVDSTPGNRDIYIQRVSDMGLSTNISTGFYGDSKAPAAGIDRNMVHVVWEEHSSGNAEVMHGRSSDRGVSFSGFKNLSNTATPSTKPRISVTSGVIRIIWTEEASPSNKEIYLATSLDSGVSFSSPVNISETQGVSEDPLMGIDTSEITHYIWVEGTSGSREIYHRQERR